MSSLQCLQTSRTALYRVFVSPLERREASLRRQLLRLPLVQGRALQPSSMPLGYQSRTLVTTPYHHRGRGRAMAEPGVVDTDPEERTFGGTFTTKEDIERSGRDRPPKDFEIKDTKIMVLDGGVLDGPLVTRHVMARLNEGDSLRMITPYIPARPKENMPAQYATCKIVNKREEYARQRELRDRRRLTKAGSTKTKELEVNWGISDHDLDTKLRQLAGFLDKGMKVELVFGHKRGKKKTDEATAAAVLERVSKWALVDAGAREYKPQDINPGRSARLYLEGTAKGAKPAKSTPGDEADESAPKAAAEEETVAPVAQ